MKELSGLDVLRKMRAGELPPGRSYGSVDLSVQMVRPVPVGVSLEAIGKVPNVSTRVGFAKGWLQDADGKRYAHATATCAIFDS